MLICCKIIQEKVVPIKNRFVGIFEHNLIQPFDMTWQKIPHHAIDHEQWFNCLLRRGAPVFAEFWYWQSITDQFEAWVKGDYEDVVAIPRSRKWGVIPTMRMPLYVKWLSGDPTFIAEQIQKFWGWRKVFVDFDNHQGKSHQVQVMRLNRDWAPSKELRKKLKKCEDAQYQIVEATWNDFSLMMEAHHPYAWPLVQRQTLQRLYEASKARGLGMLKGVWNGEQWLSIQFYIQSRDQMSLIQNVSHPEFRNDDPMAFLLSHIFKKAQNQSSTMYVNFMGSDHAGVAKYNQKFGAENLGYWEW